MIPADNQDQLCVEPSPLAVEDRPADHILIIDDDQDQSTVLKHRFTRQGFRVSICDTCQAGTEAVATEVPDLVLLDVSLPDGDGLEMCADLSDGDQTSDIPVIIVSGTEKPDIVRRARAAGCRYFVRKPYDPNALLILAEDAIAQSREW